MPKKAAKIRFDMEGMEDISDELIEVKEAFYTRRTSIVCGSLRFPIPRPVIVDLELTAGDICYFCEYSEGYYLSFKIKPEAATKAQVKSRKLATAGANNTLFVAIPPMIKKLYREPITNVKLIQPIGYPKYEWQIQFLTTVYT